MLSVPSRAAAVATATVTSATFTAAVASTTIAAAGTASSGSVVVSRICRHDVHLSLRRHQRLRLRRHAVLQRLAFGP